MKVCIVQFLPIKGDIDKNIENHLKFIRSAVLHKTDIIVFPELSVTGYEPELAKDLATTKEDKRLVVFRNISNSENITICVGLPTRENEKVYISMIIFQPHLEPIVYSKQHLYPTEVDIFSPGNKQIFLQFDNNIIAPAICYELSIAEHSENAYKNKANIYIASVLNSVNGVDSDIYKLSEIANKYKMIVFMANYIGFSGGYECAGKSSVWDTNGNLIEQLNGNDQGMLIFDTNTQHIEKVILN